MVDNSTSDFPIDAVILWVDGDDKKHRQKMLPYLKASDKKFSKKKIRIRFGQVNEIEYSIKSILKYAPYVRNIFLVTDNQTPNFLKDSEITPEFSKVKIVDHSVIFKKHMGVLPTFNCLPIETMLYNIPNLSEYFIYFNDDLFLIKETTPSDFFIDKSPILRGEWRIFDKDILYKKLHQTIVKFFDGKLKNSVYGFKRGQQNIVKKLGFKKYFKFDHTPAPMRKSTIKNYFEVHPDMELINVKHRFRDVEQFTLQSLANHIEIRNETCILKSDYQLIYIGSYTKPLFWYKLLLNKKNKSKLFLCMQNLDLCPPKKQKFLLNWLNKRTK
ncbi:MAG: stealth family protein [Flavobacteriaceae bacterium]